MESKKEETKESNSKDRSQNKEDISKKVQQLKSEISSLSSNLKTVSEQKEKQYQEKESIDQTLNKKIKDAKDLKEKKENTDIKIKQLKKKRDTYNKETRDLFNNISQIKKKLGIEKSIFNSKKIQDKIDALQYTIETEVLSINREKKYMEEIKKLKVKLKEIIDGEKKFVELKELRDKLKTKKNNADDLHKEIQHLANQSSKLFQELTKKSKEIFEIKNKKSFMRDKLRIMKKQISEINKKLVNALKDWSKVRGKTLPFGLKIPYRGKKQKKIITPEDLIKDIKGKKLTKEDLLALQKRLG